VVTWYSWCGVHLEGAFTKLLPCRPSHAHAHATHKRTLCGALLLGGSAHTQCLPYARNELLQGMHRAPEPCMLLIEQPVYLGPIEHTRSLGSACCWLCRCCVLASYWLDSLEYACCCLRYCAGGGKVAVPS